MLFPLSSAPSTPRAPAARAQSDLAANPADRLEAAFLAEMLNIAMPDSPAGAFGGGVGESQFASFMTEHHAAALAARLDLGLIVGLEGRDD